VYERPEAPKRQGELGILKLSLNILVLNKTIIKNTIIPYNNFYLVSLGLYYTYNVFQG
jgi:hypothetical protein